MNLIAPKEPDDSNRTINPNKMAAIALKHLFNLISSINFFIKTFLIK